MMSDKIDEAIDSTINHMYAYVQDNITHEDDGGFAGMFHDSSREEAIKAVLRPLLTDYITQARRFTSMNKISAFQKGVFNNFAAELQELINSFEEGIITDDPVKIMHERHGGQYWNSGGGCMVWSLEDPRNSNRKAKFQWLHASMEIIIVYECDDNELCSHIPNDGDDYTILFEKYFY